MTKRRAPLLPRNVAAHKSRQRLRQKLIEAIRNLCLQVPVHTGQDLLDFSTRVDPDVSMDFTRLPVQPTGFFVRLSDIAAYKGKTRILILLRMVSMASMYYWLYCKTEDDQDKRSAYQYIKWINNYKIYFQVYGSNAKGFYLADPHTSVQADGKKIEPPPPTWITEGTTV